MTYSINAATPAFGTCSEQTPYPEVERVSSINKIAFFTFSSLAIFFAVSSSTPLMPVVISITASLLTGAILTAALTSSHRTPVVHTSYTSAPLYHPRTSYYRPYFHYIPFPMPSFHHRPCYSPPRRDCVGERGPTEKYCRPAYRQQGLFNEYGSHRPVHRTTTNHHMSFTCPNFRINKRRDVVGGR